MQSEKNSQRNGFFSPSLQVTDQSLMRDKIIAENLSKELSLQLGHYVNNELEKKI